MHCLDVVRMALYRDRYDKHFYYPNGTVDYCKWLHVGMPSLKSPLPLQSLMAGGLSRRVRELADPSPYPDHCLDQVRQALMCQADISVVYYAWSNITQGMRPRSITCTRAGTGPRFSSGRRRGAWRQRTGIRVGVWSRVQTGRLRLSRGGIMRSTAKGSVMASK